MSLPVFRDKCFTTSWILTIAAATERDCDHPKRVVLGLDWNSSNFHWTPLKIKWAPLKSHETPSNSNEHSMKSIDINWNPFEIKWKSNWHPIGIYRNNRNPRKAIGTSVETSFEELIKSVEIHQTSIDNPLEVLFKIKWDPFTIRENTLNSNGNPLTPIEIP